MDKYLRVYHKDTEGLIYVSEYVHDNRESFATVQDANGLTEDEPEFHVDESPLTRVNITKVCTKRQIVIQDREVMNEVVTINFDLTYTIVGRRFRVEEVPYE